MKILAIGGTGFIGCPLVRELVRRGHHVSVFHRGATPADPLAQSILGERSDLPRLRPQADVVVDLIPHASAANRATPSRSRAMRPSANRIQSLPVRLRRRRCRRDGFYNRVDDRRLHAASGACGALQNQNPAGEAATGSGGFRVFRTIRSAPSRIWIASSPAIAALSSAAARAFSTWDARTAKSPSAWSLWAMK